MLMWLTDGHAFHAGHALETCLLCGNPITKDRLTLLAYALDDKIDQFVTKLSATASHLDALLSSLSDLEEAVPSWDTFGMALRQVFKAKREGLIEAIRDASKHLANLQTVLAAKQKQPAMPADLSKLSTEGDVAATVKVFAEALVNTNALIAEHNQAVENFVSLKEKAEYDIRKHFLADCRADYTAHSEALKAARLAHDTSDGELTKCKQEAERLRRQIKTHGPAAAAINGLIASYLGHEELAVHPVEQGYELHRHGKAIRGLPSEGEKTAIAIVRWSPFPGQESG